MTRDLAADGVLAEEGKGTVMAVPSVADLYPMHDVVWMGPYRVLEADDGCHHHVIWPT